MLICLTRFRTTAIAVSLGLSLLLTGCMPSSSPDTYGNHGAGTRATVQHGVIIDIRSVKLKGSNLGAPVGAAAGGIGGSFIGNNTRTSLLGALGGAVVGGVSGYYIDQKLTSRDAVQYIITLTNKKTIAVVQGKTPALSKGQSVLVLIDKTKTRVIADDSNSNIAPAAKSKPAASAPPSTNNTTQSTTSTASPTPTQTTKK